MPEEIKRVLAPNKVAVLMRTIEAERMIKDEHAKQETKGLEQLKAKMVEKDVEEYIVDDGQDKVLSALLYKRVSIKYDLEKLKRNLSKQKLKAVSDSFLTVEEQGLRDFLKAHPNLKDELKQFIRKQSFINEAKLESMFQAGIIDVKDLKDCYTTTATNVLKLQRKKSD